MVFTGQPGIGKSWFLWYVFVERLPNGETTILQVPDAASGVAHYLFDSAGLRSVDASLLKGAIARDTTIWALVDGKIVGMLAKVHSHAWLVIVASSPKTENYKVLTKQCSAPVWYIYAGLGLG